jgi:hypothetical protein
VCIPPDEKRFKLSYSSRVSGRRHQAVETAPTLAKSSFGFALDRLYSDWIWAARAAYAKAGFGLFLAANTLAGFVEPGFF